MVKFFLRKKPLFVIAGNIPASTFGACVGLGHARFLPLPN